MDHGPLGALQRIQIRPALAYISVGGDQLLNGRAFAAHLCVTAALNHTGSAKSGALGEGVDHRQMGYVLGVAAIAGGDVLQRIKIAAPRVGHAAGIGKVVLVHLLDIRGIAAEEIGVATVCGVDGLCLTHVSLTSIPLGGTLAG